MKYFLLTIFPTFLVGCSSTYGPVNANNFQEKILVERKDKTFALGESLLNKNECFPVITKPICWVGQREKSFVATEIVDMQMYEISNTGRTGIQKDYLYLAASEVAMQENFPMFTPLEERLIITCSKGVSYETHGNILGTSTGLGYLNSKTTVEDSTQCLVSKTLSILFFKDKDALKKGILQRTNSGIVSSENFVPMIDLYRGITPNLPHLKDIDTPTTKVFTNYIENAWKYHYEPKALSFDIRKKLGVTSTKPWYINDEFKKNQDSLTNDPISKRRISY